jgi:hypothetical protein
MDVEVDKKAVFLSPVPFNSEYFYPPHPLWSILSHQHFRLVLFRDVIQEGGGRVPQPQAASTSYLTQVDAWHNKHFPRKEDQFCVVCSTKNKQGQNSDAYAVMWGCVLILFHYLLYKICISEDWHHTEISGMHECKSRNTGVIVL